MKGRHRCPVGEATEIPTAPTVCHLRCYSKISERTKIPPLLGGMTVFISFFCCVVPPVTTLRMDASMTAFAQRNEIVSVVRTALCKRQLVMDFLDWNDDAPAETLLTEGMGLNIAGTDPRPRSAVPTAYSRVTAILLVVFIRLFSVFLAVPVMCQLSTSRPMAWVGRLIWHS